jgi:hypothetical protein
MIKLKNISLIAIGSTKIKQTHLAIKRCCRLAEFSSVYFLTDSNATHKDITYIKIPKINNKLEYQSFIVKDFPKYIIPLLSSKESHILVINWDGFIVNPNAWKEYFLDFDYIGAPWIKEASPILAGYCGNGGFCLKSKKFLTTQKSIEEFKNYTPTISNYEDVILSFTYRKKFERLGCKYAPIGVGFEFSTEHGNYYKNKSFGFHSLKSNKQFISKIL